MADNKEFPLNPCTTGAGESGRLVLQQCTKAEEGFTREESALKRKAPTAGSKSKACATKRKGDDGCATAAAEEEPAAEKEVLDHGTNVTEATDKLMDDDNDDDDDDDDENEDDDDFDTVYAECKKQHEEHLQQLIDSLQFVLKFKDYSIDSDGEENQPVEWK